MKIVCIILYLLFSVGGLVLMKLGSNHISIALRNGTFNFSMGINAILGFISYILSFLIYSFYIIKNFDLSYIFPILTGITQVLIIIFGIVLFKEHISIFGFFGIFMIILGIIFLNIR